MKLKLINYSLPLIAGTVALFTAVSLLRAAGNKPNIVHIVADDLGWKDVGFNGCTDITPRAFIRGRRCLIWSG